jgi:hypothetical protein
MPARDGEASEHGDGFPGSWPPPKNRNHTERTVFAP